MNLVCCECGKEKPELAFGRLSSSDTGYNYYCKECRNRQRREYYARTHKKQRQQLFIDDQEAKICCRCKKLKVLSEFSKRPRGLETRCKDCLNKERRERYQRGKA